MADVQLLRDLRTGFPKRDEADDLHLAIRQRAAVVLVVDVAAEVRARTVGAQTDEEDQPPARDELRMGREVHPQGAAVRLHHLGVAHVLVPHDQRVPLLLCQLGAFAHKAVEGLADHIARAAVDEFGERAVCVDGDPVLVGEQHGVAGPFEGGAEQRRCEVQDRDHG